MLMRVPFFDNKYTLTNGIAKFMHGQEAPDMSEAESGVRYVTIFPSKQPHPSLPI